MARPRERIYPFFLGMAGCPGGCVYCDQHRTADPREAPSPADVTAALDRELGPPGPWTVAFYGGTFTGLAHETIVAYLGAVWASRKANAVVGVRISTRPDMVNDGILAVLAAGGARTIELGVQSFDERVLSETGRGYSSAEALEGCAAVKRAGLVLGVQLMAGLPGEDEAGWRASVEKTVEVAPEFVRLYPTLVVKGTELVRDYAAGKYVPLDLDEAVTRCADGCEAFLRASIRVERIGLQEVPGLADEVVAGPYHPAFGDLVWTEVMRRRLVQVIRGRHGPIKALANSRTTPAVIGYKRGNIKYLRDTRGLELAVRPDDRLGDYIVRIDE